MCCQTMCCQTTFCHMLSACLRSLTAAHSLLSFAGLAIEAVVFYLFTGISDPLDHFVLSHEATMYLPTIVLVVFLLIYPRPARWTNA